MKQRKRSRLERKDIIKRFINIHGNKYDYSLFIFINSTTKGKIKCNICNHIFEQTPNTHLQGYGCINCRNIYFSKLKIIPQEDIIERFIKLHGNKYDYSKAKSNGIHNKLEIICLVNNHGSFWQTPNNHLKGHGCPKCSKINQAKSITLSQEEIIKRFQEIHGDRYKYNNFIHKGFEIKGEINCEKHGPFYQTPNNHLKGQGCPNCRRSKGERFIETILNLLNIEFIQEYKIEGYRFEYDFYLPNYKLFIEFHGRQHYEVVDVFGGIEGLKYTQKCDMFKRELVKLRGEKLIIFNYKQLNFKKLKKLITKLLKK